VLQGEGGLDWGGKVEGTDTESAGSSAKGSNLMKGGGFLERIEEDLRRPAGDFVEFMKGMGCCSG